MAFSSTGPPPFPLEGVAAVSAFVTSSCRSSIDLSAGRCTRRYQRLNAHVHTRALFSLTRERDENRDEV